MKSPPNMAQQVSSPTCSPTTFWQSVRGFDSVRGQILHIPIFRLSALPKDWHYCTACDIKN